MRNISTNIILQMITALQGFIVSRIILSVYGSAVNGMINSISQFLIYAGLAELGIGNAAMIAFYKPVADGDWETINKIAGTVKRKYFFSGMIYLVIVFVIAAAYPFAVNKQIDYEFAYFMVIVIGASNLAEYFMLAKYKVFLSAVQKYYVLNAARSISIFISLMLSILLMLNNHSLVIVKGVIVLTRICEALVVKYYTESQYPRLRDRVKSYCKINQQNNSLVHQIANIVIYNTDLVVLTLCLPKNSLYEISVYTVYAMPCNMIINLLNTLTNGVNATFGNMISKGKKEALKGWYDLYEFTYFAIIFSAYTCLAVMLIPFIKCYTSGVYDIDYNRLSVGLLFCFSGLTAHVKGAAVTLILGAGHFKQTQKYILSEAVSNIMISLALVKTYGVAGVLTGTILSHIMVDPGYINYANRVILNRERGIVSKRLGRNSVLSIVLFMAEYYFIRNIEGWIMLILNGVIILIINVFASVIVNLLMEPEKLWEFKNICLKAIIRKYTGE